MIYLLPEHLLVFDVESVGLHGEAFAVGYVVVGTKDWDTCDEGLIACLSDNAAGRRDDHDWVEEHIPKRVIVEGYSCEWVQSPREVRDAFWRKWLHLQNEGAWLTADVAWPVEARFLNACVDDDAARRNWEGPYPLLDIASVRLAAGLHPLGVVARTAGELPVHNPLADARQSARLLGEAFRLINKE